MKIGIIAGLMMLLGVSVSAEILVENAYVRSASPAARSGGGYLEIFNSGDTDDRFVEVRGDAAMRFGLHSTEIVDGIANMIPVENGFVVPAGGSVLLAREGHHIMLMGLNAPLVQGETVSLILVFENAGEIIVEFVVDRDR